MRFLRKFRKKNKKSEEMINKLVIGILVFSIELSILSNELNTNDPLTAITNKALSHFEFSKDFNEDK